MSSWFVTYFLIYHRLVAVDVASDWLILRCRHSVGCFWRAAVECINKHLNRLWGSAGLKMSIHAHFFLRAILIRKLGQTGLFSGVQDCKSLCAPVTICVTLVNTQACRQTAFWPAYVKSSVSWAKQFYKSVSLSLVATSSGHSIIVSLPVLSSHICIPWNVESALFRGFWPKLRVRRNNTIFDPHSVHVQIINVCQQSLSTVVWLKCGRFSVL